MSGIQQMLLGGGAAAVASVAYAGNAISGTSFSPKTFSARAIGTASADRYLVICAYGKVASSETITALTVGGASCTLIVQNNNATNYSSIWISDAPFTSGTTADIVLTISGTFNSIGVSVHALTGLVSNTATATASTDTDGGSMSLAISAGGVAVGCAVTVTTAIEEYGYTASGVTEDFENATANHSFVSGGSIASATAQTLSVIFDYFGGSDTSRGAVCASFL